MGSGNEGLVFDGEVVVHPANDATEFEGASVAELAAHRRDDIMIALEVHRADVCAAIARVVRGPDVGPEDAAEASDVAVSLETMEGGVFKVHVDGDATGTATGQMAASIAATIRGWIEDRARKLKLWRVDVRVEVERSAGTSQVAVAAAKASSPRSEPTESRKREQPVLWGMGAVLLLVGLTLGSFILVSVLAVGD